MPGGKKVTLKEIAERTGVSLGSVHRAIYGKGGISEETRRKILEEVERSHYQVDEAASVLKRGARTIGVVLPRPQGDDRFYFRAIWQGIRRTAPQMEQYKLYFRYIESEYPLSKIAKKLEEVYDLMAEEIDGLITVADSDAANVWIERFARRGVTVVLVSSNYDRERSADKIVECIRADLKISGQLAAEFMSCVIRPYRGKILIVGGGNEILSVNIYSGSFQEEIRKSCPGYEVVFLGNFDTEGVREEFIRLIKEEEIAAVFACSARSTYAVCSLLEEYGRGGKIFMIGSDVFEEAADYFDNGILNAAVCQYHWEQGERAVRRMYEHLSKGCRNVNDIMLPSILVMKANYRCFLAKHPGISEGKVEI